MSSQGINPPPRLVFGPVASRRLGLSLGVDVVPYKVCPYDCVYCQVGATTTATLQRSEFFPLALILDQLRDALQTGVDPDYITLSGCGEPTLYSRLGELVDAIRQMSDKPIAVITNGALLHDPGVRAGLLHTDLVLPSLDGGDEEVWRRVNHPCAHLRFSDVVEGLVTFAREYGGLIWLEVMLVEGAGDPGESVPALRRIIERVRPHRVQLNTIVRPPVGSGVTGVSPQRLQEIADRLGPPAEIIASFSRTPHSAPGAQGEEGILDLLARHPCTVADVVAGLGVNADRAQELLEGLCRSGRATLRHSGTTAYFDVAR